jgi:hypothetical protein
MKPRYLLIGFLVAFPLLQVGLIPPLTLEEYVWSPASPFYIAIYIIAVAFCLIRRANCLKSSGFKSTTRTLSSDYAFNDYITINLGSLLFSLVQGFFLAALFVGWNAFITSFLFYLFNQREFIFQAEYLWMIVGSFFVLVLARIFIEVSLLFFNIGTDIGKIARR